MTDYSQFGEQAAILAALENRTMETGLGVVNVTPRDPGRFLDIGAFHATEKSNTRALFERGWGGVLIEPSPGPLQGLVREYGTCSRVELIGAAVALEPGLVTLHVTDDAVTTSSEAVHETWKDKGGYYGSLLVPAVTLEQISNQFGGFDFVNIDAEGVSVDLFLRIMELQWEPHCICVEHDNRLAELLAKATERGYACTLANGTNCVLVRK